ncbi:uncharacterized protein LOC108328684 isoform X2 [Vigna angularis]|uniref:uncharacterized protein LOC108328684 isoform X2 n=1 Tax=Phaseolus angularis TaxID=3914 RepID=UPI00080A1699|nr:uncharacterized protein LOC108328684 isoform X2 [Vigna angularis]
MARGIPVSEFNPIHEIQFEEVLGRSDGLPNPAGEFHVQTQSQDVQQTEQQGLPNFPPNYSYEIGESSSSRNVRVESSIDLNTQQSLQQGISDLHLDTYETGETSSARNVRMRRNIEESLMESVYPTSPVTANPSPPPQVTGNSSASEIFRNSAYDPSFEMRGLPLDPHLRLFFFNNNPEQAAAWNTLYDPSFEERGLPLDPHLRCFALELAKKNGGNDDKLDLN